MNINIGTKETILFSDSKLINFKFKYGLSIKRVLITEKVVYVLLYPDIDDTRDPNYKDFDYNNVFAFNLMGEMLWYGGKRIEISKATGKTIEMPCEYIKIDGNAIKLFYHTDYEVWHDPATGEKIKEEYVFKK